VQIYVGKEMTLNPPSQNILSQFEPDESWHCYLGIWPWFTISTWLFKKWKTHSINLA